MDKIGGVMPALVTPFDKDEALNLTALRVLVNHVIAGGVHGLFALGSQGEFWTMTREEKKRVIDTVVQETHRRVPVYVGTAALTTREAIALSQMAEQAGADALSVLTPFFVNPNPAELYDHYRAIARAVSIPVLLYTNPARTNTPLSPQLVAELAKIPNIRGIKDSSGDLTLTGEYIRRAPPGFAVLSGRDTLILATLVYGGAGSIAATANVVPSLVAGIYDRFMADDYAGAREAQEKLAPLRLAFELGTFPVVIKEALNMMGIDAGPARRPVGEMSETNRAQLRSVLSGLGAL